MDTFAAIEARRAVKKFDPDHRMTEAEIERLLGAAARTPTSFNIQNYRFVAVTDPDLKRRIRAAGWNQAQFSECSLLLIICGDRRAYAEDPDRYWANVDPATRKTIVGMITSYYGAHTEARRDENFRSGSMAAMTIMLAAQAMGYDSCPMVGFDFDAVAELIALPPAHDIIMAVAVGKAVEPAGPRTGSLPLEELVVRNRFGA